MSSDMWSVLWASLPELPALTARSSFQGHRWMKRIHSLNSNMAREQRE